MFLRPTCFERGHGHPDGFRFRSRIEDRLALRSRIDQLFAPLSVRSPSKIAHIQRIDCGAACRLSHPPRREQAPRPFCRPYLLIRGTPRSCNHRQSTPTTGAGARETNRAPARSQGATHHATAIPAAAAAVRQMRHHHCHSPRIRGGPTGFRGSMSRLRAYRHVLARLRSTVTPPPQVLGASSARAASGPWSRRIAAGHRLESSPMADP